MAQSTMNSLCQIVHIKRLDNKIISSEAESLPGILSSGTESNNGKVGIGAQLLYNLETVHLRHNNIQQHNIRIGSVNRIQRLLPVEGSNNLVT